MSRKICILHPAAWEDSDSYSIEFVKALNKIKAQDTEYFVKACPPGPGKYPVVDYFMNALEIPKLCEGAMEAEKEGADAIVIACTDDPGLRVIRTLVDIPVIGEMESTLHLACMMGHRFGLVSWPTRAFMNRGDNLIRLYGLEANAVSQPTEPVVVEAAGGAGGLYVEPTCIAFSYDDDGPAGWAVSGDVPTTAPPDGGTATGSDEVMWDCGPFGEWSSQLPPVTGVRDEAALGLGIHTV